MKGDIAFAGFVLTASEWQDLDPGARAALIAVATNKSEPMMAADAPLDPDELGVELIDDVDDGWDLGDDALEIQYLGRRYSTTGGGSRLAKGTTPPIASHGFASARSASESDARGTPTPPIVARPTPAFAQGSGPMAVQPAPADDFEFDLMPDAIPPSY